MITLECVLILVFTTLCLGRTAEDKSACYSDIVSSDEVVCQGASVYKANEGRCVDIRQFTCPKSSWRTVEYLPDPYLCNVHHMCYQGVEVSRVCCSSEEIFSHKFQTCTEPRSDHMFECKSDPCALEHLDDVCSFSLEPKTGATYPNEACPEPLMRDGPLLHSSAFKETYQTYEYPIWEERVAEPNCTGYSNGDSYCANCANAVLCLEFGGNLTTFNATCDDGSACSNGACVPIAPGIDCACISSTGLTYQPDPYTDEAFITCIEGDPYFTECGEGEKFDSVSKCVVPITTTTVATTTPGPCNATGLGITAISCYEYQLCTADGGSPIINTCSEGQFFDQNTNLCVEQVPPFTCTTSGSFADPYDCRQYYICNDATLFVSACCLSTEKYDETTSRCVVGACISNFDCRPNITSEITTTIASGSTPTQTTSGLVTTTTTSGLDTPASTSGLETTTTTSGVDSTTTTSGLDTPASTSGLETTTTTSGVDSTTTTSGLNSTPTTPITLPCDGTNDGQCIADPEDPKGYFCCSNGQLIHGTCLGTQEFDCVHFYCTIPSNVPPECKTPANQ